ncbi:MAG: helix-turn-helix transcriptional regulator [Bacteroidetes bacterium]|nr:helix-turn-helix transcriptional regulator [Bacteroidota bacterium]
MYESVSKNTVLSSFINKIDEGLLSSIFAHSVSAIIIYDFKQNKYLHVSKNCREILGESIYQKIMFENEFILNLVAKPYSKKVEELITWNSSNKYEKTELRFSINLPLADGDDIKIFLTRYMYLPQQEETALLFLTDLTDETPFDSLIFTVEKIQPDGEHLLLAKETVSTSLVKYTLLSPRENEVMKLIKEGNKSNQIAEKLGISVHTVSTIRKNIKKKNKTTPN